MISHHIYLSVAMAHKESQIEAARQAHQARSPRRLARTSHPRRVTVVDDRQGLGASTELLTQLPGRGRREGIRHSAALVSADRTAMTGLRNMSAEIAGRADVSTRAGVISHQRNQLPLPGPRRCPERRPRTSRSTA
jgi:hypothetical protein